MPKNRKFLYPVETKHRIRARDYRPVTSADYQGYRLTHFEARSSVAHPANYGEGILIEPPRSQPRARPFYVFGKVAEINGLARELKRNPEKVLAEARPQGPSPSGYYYLDQPAPSQMTMPLTPGQVKEQLKLDKRYKETPSDSFLRTREQLEAKAARDHLEASQPMDPATGKPMPPPSPEPMKNTSLVSPQEEAA